MKKTETQEWMDLVLRRAVQPTGNDEPRRDLWPQMLQKLDEKPVRMPWFDWALAGGIVGLALVAPASIPLLFYYM